MQAASRIGESSDVIALTQLSIKGDQVTVTGDIRNVGTRSMTVLAAFTEEVAKLTIVTDFKRPPFTREPLPEGGFHSPFTVSFTIAD